MSGRGAVQRDAAWVEREYGREKWPAVLELVEAEIAADGPEPQLGRVLARVLRRLQGDAVADPLGATPVVIGGQPMELPGAAGHGAMDALVVESVIGACREDTGAIVELGSGPGQRLLSVWLAGGPEDALYVAAEYTDAGRRVTDRLAALDPRLHCRSLAFDYHAPDLTQLPRAAHAVVYSVHSIEQIPQLPRAAVDAMRGVADRVTGLHFEPVGWQLGSDTSMSSGEYAERHDYNRNLVELLRAEEAAGGIRILGTAANVIGTKPTNATSVVVWESV